MFFCTINKFARERLSPLVILWIPIYWYLHDLYLYESYVVKFNKKKEKTGFYTVLHNLKITKKQQSVFNNIKVTVYLDESMREIILPHTVLKFGTAVDDKIDITKDSKGIETARIMSITDSLGFDENIRRLSKDIKVQVIWDCGEEYVNIPHSAINLEIINK